MDLDQPDRSSSHSAVEFKYLTINAELGVTLIEYLRFQYGVHTRFRIDSDLDFPYTEEMFRKMDVGLNAGLFYYPSKLVGIGLRYQQGLINSFKPDQSTKGLNYRIGLHLNLVII